MNGESNKFRFEIFFPSIYLDFFQINLFCSWMRIFLGISFHCAKTMAFIPTDNWTLTNKQMDNFQLEKNWLFFRYLFHSTQLWQLNYWNISGIYAMCNNRTVFFSLFFVLSEVLIWLSLSCDSCNKRTENSLKINPEESWFLYLQEKNLMIFLLITL